MTTIARQRSARPFGLFSPGSERDDDVGVALATGTGTIYSKPIYGPTSRGHMAIHLDWSAGNTGTFSLWFSVKPNPDLANDNDWVQDTTVVTLGSSLSLTGSAGKCIIFVGNVLPEWARIKYVNASGTGTKVKGYCRIDGDHR